MSNLRGAGPRKGRGAPANPDPRYLPEQREAIDDGWTAQDPEPRPLRTTVTDEAPRTIIAHNRSPDIPFDQSINPYRGCEHGCIYCYARPTHAYMDLSPGLDFESRLFAKPNAAALLRTELRSPGYRCSPIALGANTDPYQPLERRRRITRSLLEVLADCRHPLTIVTKSALVERDIDLLAPMAQDGLVEVYLSITTLDRRLARRMEPRATAPERRAQTLEALSRAGIPCGVLFAPVIPALNDRELEAVLEAAAGAGARFAGYVLLRLPREVGELFQEWLEVHEPLKAAHVMNLLREMRGGRDNDPEFGSRMRGSGVYAQLIRQRFERACARLGLDRSARRLNTALFTPPAAAGDQLGLF